MITIAHLKAAIRTVASPLAGNLAVSVGSHQMEHPGELPPYIWKRDHASHIHTLPLTHEQRVTHKQEMAKYINDSVLADVTGAP